MSQIVRFLHYFIKKTCLKFENLFVLFIYFKFVVLGGFRGRAVLPDYSMARANLNKSEKFLKNTTAASKPKWPRICINRNSPFQTSKTVSYEVNLVSQCSHLEVLLLSKFGCERGD